MFFPKLKIHPFQSNSQRHSGKFSILFLCLKLVLFLVNKKGNFCTKFNFKETHTNLKIEDDSKLNFGQI